MIGSLPSKVPLANRLVVELHSRILLNIKLRQTKFRARIIRRELFKHPVAIEWEDRDSGNGSSRSRALVGLSRAFRASPVSAVKSCSVHTSECASTPRCFKPSLPLPLPHRWHKGYDQVPTPLIGSPLHRRACHPLLRVICSFDSFPMSTQFPRAIGDLVWTATRIPSCLPE